MVKKVYQNPEGGLNAKGRAYFKAKEGANLKPPVSSKEARSLPRLLLVGSHSVLVWVVCQDL